jgi:MFS transporter, DHA1 family, multidrug resistance protein
MFLWSGRLGGASRFSRPDAVTPPRHSTFVLGFIIAIGPVSVDMYLPAFSLIAKEFGAAAPQLTLAAYFFGFAAGQMAQGLLADRFGRRLPLTAGLALYTVSSLLCAGATSVPAFCLFRFFAAFGAAAAIVVPRAMVRDIADGSQAAVLMSGVMQVMSVAPVIAPAAGSLVLLSAGWRGIFIVAAAYGIAGLVLLRLYLPETLPPERRLAIGVLPTLRLFRSTLRERGFLGNALIGTFGMGALFAYLAGAPTAFMALYGLAQWQFGLVLALLGVATIGFFRLNRFLVVRHGTHQVITLGIIIWLAASLCLVLLALRPSSGAVLFFLALLIFGLGYSFIPSNAQIGALSHHMGHAATATALMSTLQYCAGGLAGALVGRLADGTARPMACIMLVCALGAAAAAWMRPGDTAARLQ